LPPHGTPVEQQQKHTHNHDHHPDTGNNADAELTPIESTRKHAASIKASGQETVKLPQAAVKDRFPPPVNRFNSGNSLG
jgi:hypothetical protein